MSNETDPTPVTDAELGAALRKLCGACSRDPDAFDWYAREIVNEAEVYAARAERGDFHHVDRVRVMTVPADQLDGTIERLMEMLTGVPCGVTGPQDRGRAGDTRGECLAP